MTVVSRRNRLAMLLGAAWLGSTALVAMPAAAQSTNLPAPPAPTGGYFMANGQRTTDYAAALDSWRKDAQFAVDYTKSYLGLEYAYVLGLNGNGQTIGINDSGVAFGHPLFGGSGKISGIRTVAPAGYGNDGQVNPRRPWEIHGTHVAGTAAGARVAGQRMFGNAYGANILSATINFAAGDFLWWKDQVLDGTTVSTPRDNIVDLANTGKVRIINNSWGSGTSLPYTASLATAQAQFRQTLNGFYDPVLKNDVLVVFSAGNGGGVHASIDAVTPLNDMRLRSNWLSVANYQANGTAAPSTSFCGQTATWCVAGPGSSVISSVTTYTVDTAAIQAKYTRAAYPGIYAATTLATLQNAATNAWLTVLNGYLNRRAAAAAAGTTFDEAAERTFAAQQAVGISLAYGARFVGGDPDGYTSTLANILTVPGNVAIIGRDFSASVLTQANTIITAELQQFIRFGGPGYGALTGTSMAAPNVSGFAALLMQAFPEYNTGLIADILVSSSRDLDTPGVDLKSGWGAPQMGVALAGPTALRQTREVTVASGTVDVWTNGITDARDRYSAEVLAGFGNDIGGLTKRGGGELILAGVSSYSGPTRVEQGLLTVNGQLTRSALTAAGGGTIGGNGTLATLTAASGGIVSPGSANAIGTLSVAGAAAFGSGSQLLIDIGASGTSDRLVAGTASLGGTLTLRPLDRLPRFGDAYTVLSANGGVTGTFAAATSFSAILFPELRYSATQVAATVAARPYASVVAATPVQTSYARLLDNNRAAYASLRGTYDLLDLQDVATIRASLEGLAPRAETARRAIGTVSLDNMARFYRERTAAMQPGNFAGGSVAMIGKPLEFAATAVVAPGQAMSVGDTPITNVRENVLPDTVSAYLAGGYLKGSGASMPGTFGSDTRDPFDGFYIAGGVEAAVTDTAMLGFGLSYSDIDGERRFGQVANGELILGTLYGKIGTVTGPALDAQFGAGVFQSQTRRAGTLVGTAVDLRGRDNALALSSEVGASYSLGSEALRIGPRVAIRASRIDFTPIAERGTGPALLIAEDRFTSVQGRAGLSFDGQANGLRPFGSAYFVHDFHDRPGVFDAGFVGGTGVRAPFAVAGQDQNWGEIGAGLAYGSERVEFSIAADASVGRDDVRNQSYRAGVKVRF
ncbi:S8 family serine peptidase [Sphingomonas sp. Leaf4]|uniref:S8 family serine peptidase n=1 Tax=Sphingomonas sp. Leaf4 TaxID=2876553 RepID=UPI001E30ED08|nr:S8 family serine peptidase [Sphingomonas sp. Leaf4]